MLTKTQEAEIVRLYHAEKWKVGTIARQLGIHHTTVRRVLDREGGAPVRERRPSIVDPYVSLIRETLEKYPKLPASRLFEMARERGYQGSPDHFRRAVAQYRPRRAAEAYLRLRTLPGEQAQVDWGHFGKLRVGRALRALMAFVIVLSWSRRIFLRFYLDARMPAFKRGTQNTRTPAPHSLIPVHSCPPDPLLPCRPPAHIAARQSGHRALHCPDELERRPDRVPARGTPRACQVPGRHA